MGYTYSFQDMKENMARVLGREAPFSRKQCIEIANYIRMDPLAKAKQKLNDVLKMKQAVPFKRFTNGLGHKRSTAGAGRYPLKASQGILSLLESAEANALYKGLNSKGLVVSHISVQQAGKSPHHGRHGGRLRKNCNIEIVLEEIKEIKEQRNPAKAAATEKKEGINEEKKEEKKTKSSKQKPLKENPKNE